MYSGFIGCMCGRQMFGKIFFFFFWFQYFFSSYYTSIFVSNRALAVIFNWDQRKKSIIVVYVVVMVHHVKIIHIDGHIDSKPIVPPYVYPISFLNFVHHLSCVWMPMDPTISLSMIYSAQWMNDQIR